MLTHVVLRFTMQFETIMQLQYLHLSYSRNPHTAAQYIALRALAYGCTSLYRPLYSVKVCSRGGPLCCARCES